MNLIGLFIGLIIGTVLGTLMGIRRIEKHSAKGAMFINYDDEEYMTCGLKFYTSLDDKKRIILDINPRK